MIKTRETLHNERWYDVEEHYEASYLDWPLIRTVAMYCLLAWAFMAAFLCNWPVWIGAFA